MYRVIYGHKFWRHLLICVALAFSGIVVSCVSYSTTASPSITTIPVQNSVTTVTVSSTSNIDIAATPTASPLPFPSPETSELIKARAFTAAQEGIVKHLYDIATTYHGKQVLAELREKMGVSSTGSSSQSDGSWIVRFHLDIWQVRGNQLMEPIVIYEEPNDATGNSPGYFMDWGITADGSKVIPVNGNAIRIEADLGK